jgi:hypothetical protein
MKPEDHRPIGTITERDIARFFDKTMPEPNSGCLLWLASVDGNGYGRFGLNGRSCRANRVAWAIANGPIPHGFVIMHRCDNPACVEATHLTAGTYQQNAWDMYAKGRDKKRKLTVDAVRRARELRARGQLVVRAFSREHGVDPAAVRHALNGATFARV